MKETDSGSDRPRDRIPDLQTQLESPLDEVWVREAEWSFEQRLQLALAALSDGPRRK